MSNSTKTLSPVVHAIGQIKFEGNIIPQAWYHCPLLRFEDGKVNMNAIIMLADILYWYRPTVMRDEETGDVIGERQRFRADKLQRSYEAWGSSFGLTKRQAADAVGFLVKSGLITREFRTIGTLNNVMFVEPVVEKIKEISPISPRGSHAGSVYPPRLERDSLLDGGGVSRSNVTSTPVPTGEGVTPEPDTYTKTPSETSLETPYETPDSSGASPARGSAGQSALFEDVPATENAKPATPPQAKTPTAVDLFAAAYLERFGIKTSLARHECVLLSQISKELGEDFPAVLAAFLSDTDQFVVKSGFAVGTLQARRRGYLLQVKGAAPVPTASGSARPGAGTCGYPEGTDMSFEGMVKHNASLPTPMADAMRAMLQGSVSPPTA